MDVYPPGDMGKTKGRGQGFPGSAEQLYICIVIPRKQWYTRWGSLSMSQNMKISGEACKHSRKNISQIRTWISHCISSMNKQQPTQAIRPLFQREHFAVIRERKTFKGRVKFRLFAHLFSYWQLLQSSGCSLFTSSMLIKLLMFKLTSLPPSFPPSFLLPPCPQFC